METCGSSSGASCLTNRTQPGQQDVKSGPGLRPASRSISSPLSSMIVRSAENDVSNTCSPPIARMDAARRFSVASSGDRPRPSPHAARTAGAIWKTTVRDGSAMASKTRSVSSRSWSAPTGQWTTHWPHREQLASSIWAPPRMRTAVCAPEPVTSHTPRVCIFSQTLTQRRHLMHFVLLRRIGSAGSHGRAGASCSNGTYWTFISRERVWSEQFPLRIQVTQWSMCWERISSTLILRVRRTRSVLVWTTMPSATTVLHAVASLSTPSISTAHTRQEATSLMPLR